MQELDTTDIKLLKALLIDGRASFDEISEYSDSSVDAVAKHYLKLKKSGVIVGSTIQFNYQKFGYTGFAMILMNVESQHITDAHDRLQKILQKFPNLEAGSFRYYNSIYNLATIAPLKNLKDLDNLKKLIYVNNEFNELNTFLWTDVRNTVENIIIDPAPKPYPVIEPNQMCIHLDELDQKIIDALSLDGRMTFSKLSQQIGVTTATVSRRYERLKAGNYIKSVIQLNPLLLGFQNILEVTLALSDQNMINDMVEALSKIPCVTYIVKISGNFDLAVVALVSDCKSIVRINDEILKIPHIKKMMATLRRLPSVWPGPRQYISTF